MNSQGLAGGSPAPTSLAIAPHSVGPVLSSKQEEVLREQPLNSTSARNSVLGGGAPGSIHVDKVHPKFYNTGAENSRDSKDFQISPAVSVQKRFHDYRDRTMSMPGQPAGRSRMNGAFNSIRADLVDKSLQDGYNMP